MKEMSFVTACKDFFGLLKDQTNIQFLQEVKKLSPQDRDEIKAGLEKNGYKIIPAVGGKE
jgi:hypothetical protein